jgi:glucose-1-phosphatase
MKSTPRFVYFDLGNVILNFDHGLACQALGKLIGLSPEHVRQLVFTSPLQMQYEAGAISTAEFCEALLPHAKIQVPHAELEYAASNIFHVNAPIIPLIVNLRGAGVPLGILSNTCQATGIL